LLALLDQPDGIVPRLVSQVGADPDLLHKELDAALERPLLTREPGPAPGQVNVTQQLRARLAERQMTLEVSAAALRFIAEQGYDPVYGARPLRRFIARDVETKIRRALLAGDVRDGAVIGVDLKDSQLTVTYQNPE
jgi:ATP-dependent Clp protease ATP-binding subunit ClpB